MGTTFAPGQLAQLLTNINIAVATALPNIAKKYDPKVLHRALDGRGEVFAGRMETAIEQALNSMLVLAPKGVTTIPLAERHDPDAFYRNRTGLYVWDGFRSQAVANARPSEAGTTYRIEGAELLQNLTDGEIEVTLPKDHFFSETDVCGLIAALIAKQPNGESGVLLNNGYANLFYTRSCVVGASWFSRGHWWSVNAWLRDGNKWSVGLQVFYPAVAA